MIVRGRTGYAVYVATGEANVQEDIDDCKGGGGGGRLNERSTLRSGWAVDSRLRRIPSFQSDIVLEGAFKGRH